MKDILKNDFNKEMIIYGITAPDTGHVSLNCSTIRKCIELGKKVLFYSLEQPEDKMTIKIGITDNTNLLIKDKLITNIEDMIKTIDSFKPDLVVIDYFMLLTRDTKVEDIYVLNRIAEQYNIPFILVTHLSATANKGLDFNTITFDEFKEANSSSVLLIEQADRFILFYQKGPKEYRVKELTNAYGETQEIDIRDLLNED